MERRTFLNISAAGLGSLAVASPLRAQFVPMPSNEKWAVVFATWYGTARDAAVWVSEGMGGIADVFDVRKPPADLAAYDHLVFGTAIQAFNVHPEMQKYLEANTAKIKGKVRGLFAVCGNIGNPPGPEQVKNYIDGQMAKLTQADSAPKAVFGGRITRVLWGEKVYEENMKMYATIPGAPQGEFDNLKRADCMKFGAEILAKKA